MDVCCSAWKRKVVHLVNLSHEWIVPCGMKQKMQFLSRLPLVTLLVHLSRCLTLLWLSSLSVLDITLHTRETDPNSPQRLVDIFLINIWIRILNNTCLEKYKRRLYWFQFSFFHSMMKKIKSILIKRLFNLSAFGVIREVFWKVFLYFQCWTVCLLQMLYFKS